MDVGAFVKTHILPKRIKNWKLHIPEDTATVEYDLCLDYNSHKIRYRSINNSLARGFGGIQWWTPWTTNAVVSPKCKLSMVKKANGEKSLVFTRDRASKKAFVTEIWVPLKLNIIEVFRHLDTRIDECNELKRQVELLEKMCHEPDVDAAEKEITSNELISILN